MVGDRGLDLRVQPHGDRHVGAGRGSRHRRWRGRRTRSRPAPAAARGLAGVRSGAGCFKASATSRAAPRGEPHEPLRSRWATTTGADVGGGDGGEQRVESADPGVAVARALLGVAVDLDDRVVDVDQHPPVDPGGGSDQRCLVGEPGQEPGGDGVELADVAEGERPQERPQRRGRVGAGEEPAHPAVPQQRHVVDRVRAGDHPRDQRGDLQPGVRALVGRHVRCSSASAGSPAAEARARTGTSPAARHEIRIIEHRRGRPGRVAKLHLRDALRAGRNRTLEKSDSPSHVRAFSLHRRAHPTQLIGGSRLSSARGTVGHPHIDMSVRRDSGVRTLLAPQCNRALQVPPGRCSPAPDGGRCAGDSDTRPRRAVGLIPQATPERLHFAGRDYARGRRVAEPSGR